MAKSEIGEAIAASAQAMADEAAQRAAEEQDSRAAPDDVIEASRVMQMKPSEILDVRLIDDVGVAIQVIGGMWYVLMLPGVVDDNGRGGLLHLSVPRYPTSVPVYRGVAGTRFLALVQLEHNTATNAEARRMEEFRR
ncbi:MAG: hypothetical protein AB7O95_13905 [Geminicoccaceae bacterium]